MEKVLPENFDWEKYLILNSDLDNKRNEVIKKYAINHYLNYGYYENRKYISYDQYDFSNNKPKVLPIDFNWETYLILNPDLNKKYTENIKNFAIKHYLNYGYYENRKYNDCVEKKEIPKKQEITLPNELPKDFYWENYIKLNPELHEICNKNNENIAINHYLVAGYYENRIYSYDQEEKDHQYLSNNKPEIPKNFFWKTYLELNIDLHNYCSNNSEKFAINHYLTIGYYENKKYKYEIDYEEENIFFKFSADKNINNYIIQENNTLNHKIHDYTNNTELSFFNNNPNIELTCSINYHPINNIDYLKSFIIIIDFANLGGGTGYFINSIISKYKFFKNFLIVRNHKKMIEFNINNEYVLNKMYTEQEAITFFQCNKHKINKIFLNHIKGHSYSFINSFFNLDKEISLITHDYSTIMKNTQPLYNDFKNVNLHNKNININKFHKIIIQNKNTLPIFKHFLTEEKEICISPLPDFNKSLELIKTNNTKTVIGVIGVIHEIKGKKIIDLLYNYIKTNNLDITIIVFGIINNSFINQITYKNINELNELLMKHKPNLLLEANLWPETWSYTLTISMLTQLPILSLKKPFVNVIEDRLSKYSKTHYYQTISDIIKLSKNVKQDYFYTINPVIFFNSFWDNYFIDKKDKKMDITPIKSFKHNIKPYIIYFPQFHSFMENDISFYPGFTDITNLDLLKKSNIYDDIITPNFKEFSLTNIRDYNLHNKNIIQKQIDIITHYGIPGFAIYFYWFSKNTITNHHMIMGTVINHFFDDSIHMNDRKVFFIWANEDWSKNKAFGTSNEKIENKYTEENMQKITDLFAYYFLKKSYLKIDNKPVLFILHPWCFNNEDELDLFFKLLNEKCIRNSFNGIHLIVNSINGDYKKYTNYSHHFNYKKGKSAYYDDNKKQIFLDYKNYIKMDIDNNNKDIQSLVFDFDNRARLFKPNLLEHSTICVNNTEFDKIQFIEKIVNKYNKHKTSEIENILLINAWNEWGEKMSMEPSQEFGYYYLNLLNLYLSG